MATRKPLVINNGEIQQLQAGDIIDVSSSATATSAAKLETARAINGVSFDGTANINITEYVHSLRDFPNGTIVTTSIDYGTTNGDPWILEIKGNSYGEAVPWDIQVQGYIYNNTIYNPGGISNGANVPGIVCLNVGGFLTFWWPRVSYWNGFNIKVYTALAGQGTNRVTNITDGVRPVGTKLFDFEPHIRKSWTNTNLTNLNQLTNGPGYLLSTAISAWAKAATKPSYTGNEITTSRTDPTKDLSIASELRWKNYGNGHTIFDASNGTSPAETAVNNTNPNNPWSATYPTLMGWNGANTYGVRVDSARVADSASLARGLTRSDQAVDSYNVQSHWNGTHWELKGYTGTTYHAGVKVAYATTAGSAPASDVSTWAKAATKPSYNASEIVEDANNRFVTDTEKTTWNANQTSLIDTDFRRIVNPGGGTSTGNPSVTTGALKVVLPVGMLNSMLRITIKVYEYATNESFEVSCGGYTAGTGNTWVNNPFAYIVGNPSTVRNLTVRFGYTAGGKGAIYIGELSSTWSYPQFFVTDVQVGYSGYAAAYETGWVCGIEAAAFENVTATISNCQVGYALSTNTANANVKRDASGNFSANVITAAVSGNADTATALQTARTINGTSFNGTSNIVITAAASDVSAWAKAATKPSYTAAEVGAATSGHTHTSSVLAAGVKVAAVTSLTTAPISIDETAAAENGFTPMIHQKTVLTSGYRKHVSIGSYRTTAWSGGVYIAQGGNDSYPTEYFLLENGGNISHSSGYITMTGGVTGNAGTANKVIGLGSTPTTYKMGFTTDAITNPGGSWGKACMIYDGNGQTYGMRVDRADYADVAGDVSTWAKAATKPSYTGNEISALRTNTSTDIETAKELRWTRFGSNHTIIDASSGLAPNGTVIGDTNSTSAWSATRPTLMGWNGSSTFGVRVDSARVADTAGSTGVLTGSAHTNGTDGWWRTAGAAGWYNETYAVGIYSNAAGQVRTYNGSNFYSEGAITATGDVTAFSDERLKTDWESLPPMFLECLAKIKYGTYRRIDTSKRQAGVSAQDLQELLPEVVLKEDDDMGTLSVAYGNAALVATIELANDYLKFKSDTANEMKLMREEIQLLKNK